MAYIPLIEQKVKEYVKSLKRVRERRIHHKENYCSDFRKKRRFPKKWLLTTLIVLCKASVQFYNQYYNLNYLPKGEMNAVFTSPNENFDIHINITTEIPNNNDRNNHGMKGEEALFFFQKSEWSHYRSRADPRSTR